MAGAHGDAALSKICGTIASDESRHELAYKRIVEELFKIDPDGAMIAFNDMMRKQIIMPAHLMNDGMHQVFRNSLTPNLSVFHRNKMKDGNYLPIMQKSLNVWVFTRLMIIVTFLNT